MKWISTKERLPLGRQPVLCILRMNDQGEYAPWQEVLYHAKEWRRGNPDGNNTMVSSWNEVVWWRPLDWP